MHHHRAEHWIVVSGTAMVTKGEKEFILSENESTYIAIGETHRLENPGTIPLEMIEVQSGSYLGEDDIVRLKDSYGRSQLLSLYGVLTSSELKLRDRQLKYDIALLLIYILL